MIGVGDRLRPKPYVMSNKNDSNDAKGIAEAVTRPDMKFVAVKNIEQQDILLLHRARELVVKQRTAQANQIRGLLMEYGIVIPQGIYKVKTLLDIKDPAVTFAIGIIDWLIKNIQNSDWFYQGC